MFDLDQVRDHPHQASTQHFVTVNKSNFHISCPIYQFYLQCHQSLFQFLLILQPSKLSNQFPTSTNTTKQSANQSILQGISNLRYSQQQILQRRFCLILGEQHRRQNRLDCCGDLRHAKRVPAGKPNAAHELAGREETVDDGDGKHQSSGDLRAVAILQFL